jgi:aminomethyltransferase
MRTPLYNRHVALGARIIEFGGWEMPVWYSGGLREHHAVRNGAGLFDVSHMGEILIEGPDAGAFLNRVTTNDVGALLNGQVQYTFMCNERGGVIDDCTLYCIRDDIYMLVVNAANIEKDFSWLRSHIQGAVTVENVSSEVGLIALQGPRSVEILQGVLPRSLEDLQYYHFMDCGIDGKYARISRTGYTGEDGFEIYCAHRDAEQLWDFLFDAGRASGLVPCGLGARDTLRLEAGMALYGNDLDEEHSPLEANLARFVRIQKQSDFIGKGALLLQQKEGVARKLVGFMMEGREIARSHYGAYSLDGRIIGQVTSGAPSPTLAQNIGLAYVEQDYSAYGTKISIRVREKDCPATVVKVPFYRRKKEVSNG